MGTTSKMSMPTLELWLSCLTKPLSMMYLQGTEAVNGSSSQTLRDRRPPSPDAVDGQRRGCDVGGHHTLPDSFGRRLKDLFLLICGHRNWLLICSKKKNKKKLFFNYFVSNLKI